MDCPSDDTPPRMPTQPPPPPPLPGQEEGRAFPLPGTDNFSSQTPPSVSAPANRSVYIAPSQPRRRPSIPAFLARVTSRETLRPQPASPDQEPIKQRNMLRKHRARDQELQKLASQIPQQPPQLPSPSPMPIIDGFGGGDRPDSVAMFSSQMHHHQQEQYKAPPQTQQSQYRPAVNNFSRPGYIAQSSSMNSMNSDADRFNSRTGNPGEAYEHGQLPRTESMTNRGRESYASLALTASGHANSPRRLRRKKDPTPFNILIIGAKKSGKTAFLEFLKESLALPAKQRSKSHSPIREHASPNAAFTSFYLETELDGERVGLTIWDSKGLEKNIVDLQLREMSSFIEAKFEDTFTEEQKVVRSPGAKDTHIHCVLLLLDPVRLDAEAAAAASPRKHASTNIQTLDEELDLQVLRALSGKTTVIPIISKADTLTSAHMASLKRNVWSSIQAAKLDPLEALGLEEEEAELSEEDDDASSQGLTSGEDTTSSDIDLPVPTMTSTHVPGDFNKVTEHTVQNYDDDQSSLIDSLVNRDSSSPPPLTSPGTTPSPAVNSRSVNAPDVAASRRLSTNMAMLAERAAGNADEIYIPFSILSPDPYTLPQTMVRVFPWGEADPMNPSHCDFARLKESVFGEWRSELRNASREKWYEGWRTSRLKRNPAGSIAGRSVTGRIRQTGGVTSTGMVPREGRRVSSAGSSSSKAEKVLSSPRGLAI